MGISILTNVASLTAQRNLSKSQAALGESIGRLSSGLRINKAADDAAGLGISENLKADIRGLAQAGRNTNDAVSLAQVAEGAMNEQSGIVIDAEFDELKAEFDRIADTTEFNGQKLIDGSASTGLTMQVGFQNTANDRISMSITGLKADLVGNTATTGSLSIASVTLSTAAGAQAALDTFDVAIQDLSSARAKVGAFQNRAQITISNLAVARENLSAANSRIRDVDVAAEAATLTKNQILSQAGLSVLGQANALPQSALSLI